MKRTLFAIGAIALAVSLLTITPLDAQTPSPSPSPSPSPIAIRAGRLLDVKTGKIQKDVFILIENHRIKSIGSEAPAGVRVIDLSNAFVMPGMVDCHAHILGDLADLSPSSSFRMSSAKKTLWGMKNLKVLYISAASGNADYAYFRKMLPKVTVIPTLDRNGVMAKPK